MKYAKHAIVVLLGLATIAAVIHWQRDAIALHFINSTLDDQGITATELSIEKIESDQIRLSHVRLKQDDGTLYRISGVSLAINFDNSKPDFISFDSVIMTSVPGQGTAEPESLASTLQSFLRLPVDIPNTEITVSRFTMPGSPAIENIYWRSGEHLQHFEFGIQSANLDVDINRVSDTDHQVTVIATVAAVPEPVSLVLAIHRGDSGFTIDGNSTIELAPWLALLQSADLLSQGLSSLGNRLDAHFRIEMDDDQARSTSASLDLSLSGNLTANYSLAPGSEVEFQLHLSDTLRIAIDYPSLTWTATTGQADVLLRTAQTGDSTIQLGDLQCRSGIQCELFVSTQANPAGPANQSADDAMLSAHINVSHNTASGEGRISVDNATVNFDRAAFSGLFSQWPQSWDIVSGTVAAELEATWEDHGAVYDGRMQYRIDTLAGHYDEIVFSGLNTSTDISVHSTGGLTIAPSSITVALLDAGVPVEGISADFSLNVQERWLQLGKISMSTLGGHLTADPFRFDIEKESNSIVLRPQSIQLQFMVDLAEFQNIELSGSISGVLPLTIKENKMTITNGLLESDPPGGVIRYLPGMDLEQGEQQASELGLVSRALSNFQFDSLTSKVDYTENGDLKLQMRLAGINPDMDATQPVILNLGVENNIPQLLRSLQATRSIEDILEKKSLR